MKKNNLFKVIGIVLLAYCVLTWIIPAVANLGGDLSTATRNQISVFGIFMVSFEAFSAFANVVLFVILVGAFYAILEKTGVYDKALDFFKKKFDKKESLFLVLVTVIIAIISSVTGLEFGLFFLFPFVISILLVMGYDKLVGLSATLGATMVGIFGSTLSGVMYSIVNQILGTSLYDGIVVKIILFVLGLALLLLFTLLYARRVKGTVKADLKKDDEKEVKSEKVVKEKSSKTNKKDSKKKADAKKTTTKNKDKKADLKKEEVVIASVSKKKHVWPMLLVMGLVLVVFILGSIDFESLGTSIFTAADEGVMGLKVWGFPIFGKLISGLSAFGTWLTPYRFQYYSVILIIAMIILSIIYRIRFSEQTEAFIKGVKDYFVAGLLVALAYTMFVLVYYYPVFNTIGTWIMNLSESFNVAVTGLFTFLSSIFYVDIYYYSYYILQYISQVVTDTSLYPLIGTMFISFYGLAMLVAPTSALLLASLKIIDVSYTTWLKYIWKLFLALFVLAFVVFLIVFLI